MSEHDYEIHISSLSGCSFAILTMIIRRITRRQHMSLGGTIKEEKQAEVFHIKAIWVSASF